MMACRELLPRRMAWRVALGVPLAVLLAAGPGNSAWAGALAAALLASALVPGFGRHGRAGLAALLLLFLGVEWAWPEAAGALALGLFGLLPAVACGLFSWGFGRTLRAGEEPLIARYIRFDDLRDPVECAGYARGLTVLWAVALGLAALLQLAPLLPGGPDRQGLAAATLAALLALFLGEHAVRSLRFPAGGIAWPSQTFRAMLRAERARHG
jgi:hypothetical protein